MNNAKLNDQQSAQPRMHLSDLEKAVEQSQSMLIAAHQEDWEEVQRIQKQRHVLVQRVFENDPEISDISVVADLVKQILSLNQSIDGLAKKSREHAASQLLNMNLGKTAHEAYLECNKAS